MEVEIPEPVEVEAVPEPEPLKGVLEAELPEPLKPVPDDTTVG